MARIDVHYQQEWITGIAGRTETCVWKGGSTWVDEPETYYDTTILRLYDLRRVAAAEIGWPVGNFSGLLVPEPLKQFQRGINPGFYGSTAFQLYGNGAGFQIATNFLDWSAGNFEFSARDIADPDELGLPTSNLILEHARLRDEARQRSGTEG